MALWQAWIEGAWIGDGTEGNENRPRLPDDYPHTEGVTEGVRQYSDVTAQFSVELHPNPNRFVGWYVMEEAVLTLIEADSNYVVIAADPFAQGP